MKKLLLTAVVLVSTIMLFSCNNAEKSITPEEKSSEEVVATENNSNIVDGLYKSFEKGDIPAVLSGLDSAVIWNEAEGNAYAAGNPYIGPDAVLNGVFARIGQDWDGFKLVNITLHEMSNDQVLATLRYNGVYKLTGKKIDAQVAHHWKLKNGKVISFQQYVDTKQLAEAAIK